MALPNQNVWTITFLLNEYMPSEVEQMTGLSTDSQRDWRRRGFLPKNERHARFDVFGVAELFVTKMFADRGINPGVAYSNSAKFAASMVKTSLLTRDNCWVNPFAAEAIFDALPIGSRRRYPDEEFDNSQDTIEFAQQHGLSIGPTNWQKREWLIDTLLRAMGVWEVVPYGRQAIWWPNGETELADYSGGNYSHPSEGLLDRVNTKFDGAATVLNLEGAGANLARRSRLPFLHARLTIDYEEEVNRPDLWLDHGKVVIERARIKPQGAGDE